MKKKILSVLAIMTMLACSLSAQQANPESDFNVARTKDLKGVVILDYIGTSKTVIIPDQIRGLPVTTIGEKAFQKKNLDNVTIPNTVTEIGDFTFSESGLTSVTIPNSVISIGPDAFYDNQLTSVTIPNSMKFIAAWAFVADWTDPKNKDNDNQITSITIGNACGLSNVSFQFGFDAFYQQVNQRAGTYNYQNGSWQEQW